MPKIKNETKLKNPNKLIKINNTPPPTPNIYKIILEHRQWFVWELKVYT